MKIPRLRCGLVCLLAIFSSCLRDDARPNFPTPLAIRVVGHDFYWRFTYPGPDGQLGTADDIANRPDLHVPLNHPVRLEITSEDYIYTFRAPELNLKEVAVPELTFTIYFTPNKPGRYDLKVDPLCGFAFFHDNDVMAQMVIEPASDVQKWLASSPR